MSISSSQPTSGSNAEVQSGTGPMAGLAYGGFWVRVVAFILDGLVLSVLTTGLAPLTGMGPTFEIDANNYQVNYAAGGLGTLFGIVYFVGFWAWRGQTPGMMPFNMKVVRADDGGKVDIVRGLLRYVGLIISFAVILIGVIWAAFDGRKQGWHDKIAGTLVVRPA